MGKSRMTQKTETQTIYETLDLSRGAWLIQGITFNLPQQQIIVNGIYNPYEADSPFQIVFEDCRLTHWDIVNDEEFDVADVIGFDLYEQETPHRAVIHTDWFEIGVQYAQYIIQKDW